MRKSIIASRVKVPDDPACHRNHVSVKLDTFQNCLLNGMTYVQIANILGYRGTLTSESGNLQDWEWNDGSGKYLSVTFVDNRLDSKSQINLD